MTQQVDPWDIPPPSARPQGPLIPRTPPPQTGPQILHDEHTARTAGLPTGFEWDADGRGAHPIRGTPMDPNYGQNAVDPASITDAERQVAQAMITGRVAPPTGRTLSSPHTMRLLAIASQLDPEFDLTTWARRNAASRAFTSGAQGQNITAFNTAIHHIARYALGADALDNWGSETTPAALSHLSNTIRNWAANGNLAGRLTTFENNADAVASELTRAFRGTNGAEADVRAWRSNLRPNMTPQEFHASVQSAIDLLRGRIEAMNSSYRQAMGPNATVEDLIDPHSREILHSLENGTLGTPTPQDGPPSGPPPTVGGAPPPSSPAAPSGPTAGGGPGPAIVATSSDTPPSEAVSPHYVQMAQQAQALFNQGATREQMDAWAVRHGLQPYGHDLDRAIDYRDRGGRGARILPPETMTPAGAVAQQLDAIEGVPGYMHRAGEGLTQGLNDEISGVARSVGNIVSSPFTGDFDPIGSYQVGRDAERIRNTEAADNTGGLGTAVEVGSSILGAAPAFAVSGPAEAASLGGRVISGARVGAIVGGGSGWAHGEGLGGSLEGAVIGAGGGAATGAAIPIATSGAMATGRGVRGLWRLATGNNPELAPRTVAQAIADDANTPAAIAAQMGEAHANGVPAMLADTGDNARGVFAATARVPGAARTMTRDALRERQEGLPDRVVAAIERDLGPVSNPHEVAANLMEQARTTAAPLYELAYSRPGAHTFTARIDNLLRRPSMQGALRRAQQIAAEEGRDPSTAGFDVNSSGEVSVTSAPSWQTLDYVKRGLDDVINAQPRNPATGQVITDEASRAIDQTRRTFLEAVDEANPDYAAARAAYAGPVQGREAMELGRRSLSLGADDLSARINRMTPYEQDMFRLGHRGAMAEHIAGRGDQSDMVGALIGTGKRRAALFRLYGDNENFPRFVSTLNAEQAAHQTFRQALTGSPTAPNIQDDIALPGAATTALADLATTGGLPVATGIRQAMKLGATRVGRNAQAQISALLSDNDPTRVSEFTRVLQERAAAREAAQLAATQRAYGYGIIGGSLAGRSVVDMYGP